MIDAIRKLFQLEYCALTGAAVADLENLWTGAGYLPNNGDQIQVAWMMFQAGTTADLGAGPEMLKDHQYAAILDSMEQRLKTTADSLQEEIDAKYPSELLAYQYNRVKREVDLKDVHSARQVLEDYRALVDDHNE